MPITAVPAVPATPDLPDVNVWLALVDERHVHHPVAARYWREQAADSLAFCRATMLGFLRLSTHPRVLGNPLSAREAWDIYGKFRALPIIRFLPEPANIESVLTSLTREPALPHRLWTDAYLAALAMASHSRLVSFDTDFQRFPKLDFLHLRP